MIIEKKNISKVKEVFLCDNVVLALREHSILNLEDGIEIEGDFYYIKAWKEYIITQNISGNNLLFLDKKLDIVKEISGEPHYALARLNDSGFIPIGDELGKIEKDLSISKIKVEQMPGFLIKSYGIVRSRNLFTCLDLTQNKKLWQYEISADKKLARYIYNIDNVIVLPTVTIDNTPAGLLGIDLLSGKLLWQLNCNSVFFIKDTNKDLLMEFSSNGVGDNLIEIIDIQKPQVVISKSFDNLNESFTPALTCYGDGKLYFISNISGMKGALKRETKLGWINLDKVEIENIEVIGKSTSNRSEFGSPVYHNGHIYVIDGEGTLHQYKVK